LELAIAQGLTTVAANAIANPEDNEAFYAPIVTEITKLVLPYDR
jgi:hypothetical protein